MIKRFYEWISLKEKLDTNEPRPPFVSVRDLWWCSIGENIGVEIGGKSEQFSRPVLIFKKFGKLGFLVIPMTTTIRTGSWYVPVVFKDVLQVAMLSQIRFISYKRLDRKMGSLSSEDFKKVKEALLCLFSS